MNRIFIFWTFLGLNVIGCGGVESVLGPVDKITGTSTAPSKPGFISTQPASPGSSLTPLVKGTADDATLMVALYSDANCTVSIGGGIRPVFVSSGVPVSVIPNSTTSIYVQGFSSTGLSSPCSFLTNYTHVGSIGSGDLLLLGLNIQNASPTNTVAASLSWGSYVGSPTQWCLLENNTDPEACTWQSFPLSGTFLMSGTQGGKTLSAWLKDGAGNISPRVGSNTVILDTVAPGVPSSPILNPVSGSASLTPFLRGTADLDTANIALFSDSACSQGIGYGTKTVFEAIGIQINVTANATTQIFSKTYDFAGNVSGCNSFATYTHAAAPAGGGSLSLGLISIAPTSPGSSTAPVLVGWASTDVANVQFYSDSSCSTLLKTDPKSTFVGAGSSLTVSANANTMIFAKGIDASSSASPCTFLTQYRNDSVSPAWTGTITHAGSYSSLSVAPVITVQMNATDASGVQRYEYAVGTTNFSGAALTQQNVLGWTEFSSSTLQPTGLTLSSGTQYFVNVRVTDVAGNVSAVRSSSGWIADTVAPSAAPVLASSDPLSPSKDTFSPAVIGTATADTETVRLYNNSSCTGLIGSGTRAQFVSTGISVTLTPNSASSIYAKALDAAGNESVCSSSAFSFEHDNIAPTVSSFSISSLNPTNSSVYQLSFGGTGGVPNSYCLLENSTNLGSCVWNTLPLPTNFTVGAVNGAKTLSLWLQDAAGNISARFDSNSITLDTVAPNSVSAGTTSPASPGSSLTPFVSGSADADVHTVQLYSDSSCASAIGSGSRAQFVSSGVVTAVAMSATTSIYAKAFDAAGNSSSCNLLTNYTHSAGSGGGSLSLGLISVSPSSPGNLSAVSLVGWTSADVATVNIYSDASCSTLLKTDAKAVFTGAGSSVTVAANTNTLLFAKGVDASSATSPCTFLTQYRHDGIVPAWSGSITHAALSSSLTDSPSITVQMNATDASGIAKYEYALGSANSSGSAAAQTDILPWTLLSTSSVQESALALAHGGTYYVNVRVTDNAGNSLVRSSAGWSVDNVAPTVPVITASNPVSPSNATFAPALSGTASADTQTVQFFADAGCSASLGSGTRAQFVGVGVTVNLLSNTVNQIYAKALDAAGNASSCTATAFVYEHNNVAPSISSFAISSATPTNSPVFGLYFGGTVGVPTHYCLQENSTTVGSCSWNSFPLPSTYTVTGTNNAKTLSLWLRNAAGNVSSRIDSNVVTLDTVAPNAPSGGATTPASPGTSLTPFITGVSDADVKNISLYSDSTCGSLMGSGSRSQFSSSGILVSVAVNSTTNIYAQTQDAAGNTSACTALITYQHLNTTTDPEMSFGIAALTVDEGVGLVKVSVRLSKARNVDTVIPFTVSGTASNPVDHDLAAGNMTIPAYLTEGFISFSVYDDPLVETDKTVVINLGTAPGGVVSGPIGTYTLTIKDNDTVIPNNLAKQIRSVASAQHTCVVIGESLACWGRNDYGQIGDGTTTTRTRPYYPPGLQTGVSQVAVGYLNTCVIQNGGVKCWGYNGSGQLGDGTTTNSLVPVQVMGLTSGVTDLSFDGYAGHGCAVHNGAAKCWGYNAFSQLGDGTTTTRSNPTTVVGLDANVTRVRVSSIYNSTYGHVGFSCALQKGAMKCWGYGGYGQLGDGASASRSIPVQVAGLTEGVTDLSMNGGYYGTTCAVHKGAAKCWGYNGSGQVGDGTTTTRATPVQVFGMTQNVTQIQAYYSSSCAIMNGELRCWGYNNYGQIGDTTTANTSFPIQVDNMADGVDLLGAGAGDSYTVCATRRGILRCWGYNNYGQIGDGSSTNRTSPVKNVALDYAGRSTITKVVQGSVHACAIQDGGLKCWGYNDYGQLGDGSAVNRYAPTPVVGLSSGVTDVVLGRYNTCAIHNGAMKCWGYNAYGQLGDGTTTTRYLPTQVQGLTANVEKIYIKQGGPDYDWACAIQSGSAFCWGYNGYGQIGDGTTVTKNIPTQVVGFTAGVTQLSLSSDASVGYTCGLKNGAAFCWGYNGYGQLGDDTTTSRSTPTQVLDLTAGVTQIATAGQYGHTCAVVNGGLKCWGKNTNGQLGVGNTTDYDTPRNVTGMASGVQKVVVAGRGNYGYTCAIQNGGAWCWGYNGYGQIGDGTVTSQLNPAQVIGLTNNVTDIVVSDGQYGATCALQTGGAAKCWGYNNYGQLGDGTTTSSSSPKSIYAANVTAVSLPSSFGDVNFTMFIKDGIIFGSGRNDYGQLGNGWTGSQSTPTEVPLFLEPNTIASGITKMAAGKNHTCLLRDGAVKCWGKNTFGQLGDGTSTDRLVPVAVGGLTADVSALEAGDSFTCAVKLGAAYCWGSNSAGQLGNNSTVASTVAVTPTGLGSNITAISAGKTHACAIQGAVGKCWGQNNYGQLGNGTATASLTPVTVGSLNGLTAISVGELHTCGLSGGQGYCWGNNGNGRLGDGTSTTQYVPTAVLDFSTNVSDISAGKGHTCGVMNGAAYCWGGNSYGQIGDSSQTARFEPTPVVSLGSSVTTVSAGDEHTCAIKNQQVRCWGRNDRSQLGVGTGPDQDVPAVVSAISGMTDVSAGGSHTCAMRRHVAYCWGANESSQVGDGTVADMPVPSLAPN
ncbi:MAG: hypothetical protein OM95_01415 [Bdellovibrio sp. ArHS]|uniref:RCC1 domain-containing protein n=1 Tax=Bdellovibrio sp. ArHS TaxID=1569284 RepID=UPI00058297C0|nr:hypothetical protein [Bdellovibrio sp. ArHS]KHD89759.1 MAG: hypothetical protein OM95_01415 [Bdellovibrio sp. ArHS]